MDAEREALEHEARDFSLALTGAACSPYVASKYADAHQHLALQPVTIFDHILLSFAAHGPWPLRAADAYARFAAPASALRRKLAVLTAILESSAPSDGAFASLDHAPATVLLQLVLAGVGFVLVLGVGCLALAPQQIAARWQDEHL